MGYTFDITSTLVERFDFGKIKNLEFDVTPKVRWRGIRQHVNFPMDISSYPIGEAKAYLDNLLRLRFNKLAVHSYPGFWHEQPQGDSILYGGNFFYDSPHFYKGNPFLKEHIRYNDSLFCIPEMEGIYFDAPLKSKKTMAWMRELLEYAKGLGFYIQFSFEPRQLSLDATAEVARHIADTYPMIDALELMTEEMGGWGASCTREEVEKTLVRFWGKEMLADSVVTSCIRDRQSDLNSLYMQLGQNMQAVSHLKGQGFPTPEAGHLLHHGICFGGLSSGTEDAARCAGSVDAFARKRRGEPGHPHAYPRKEGLGCDGNLFVDRV